MHDTAARPQLILKVDNVHRSDINGAFGFCNLKKERKKEMEITVFHPHFVWFGLGYLGSFFPFPFGIKKRREFLLHCPLTLHFTSFPFSFPEQP